MQFIIALSILSSVVAFAPVPKVATSSTLQRSDVANPAAFENLPLEPPAPKVALPAKWFPFGNLKAPMVLDGTLAADAGFDPIGLADSKKTLYWMREAEVKHARLAMLAAVGWPLSELWHKNIAQTFGLQSILVGANGDRAPSLLNGGLDSAWASSMLFASIIISSFLESKAMEGGNVFWAADKPADYTPGDFGFDPLRLYKSKGDKKSMETAELKNGRLAMLAITGYAFSEIATGMPVIQETPYLF